MRTFRALAVAALVGTACTPATAPATPSPTPLAPLVLVGGAPEGTIAERARLLNLAQPATTVVARPGRRGSDAIAELVREHAASPRALAAVGAAILASEVLEDVSPRVVETVPVARLPSEALVIAVAALSPIADAKDLRRRLERDASEIRFAGGPQATLDHLLAAAIVRDATHGVSGLVYAAHASAERAIDAVARGQSQVAVAPYATLRGAPGERQLRVIGVSSAVRLAGIDVPTLRESGIEVVLLDWAVLVAPPGIVATDLRGLKELAARARGQPEWSDAVRRNAWLDDFATEGLTTFLGTELTRTIALLRDLKLVK